ncbi:Zn(II)2Cys6 transcription factor domain-containing protein [Aspergillus fischeri NRRL 181]|uniref:C6 finger domain protein, putative n=1 Tax=Neosartorya fischeri (strain ATCC 1020 / DSM 3700 / CBS 544.65 / FGSC A1164 / JCM 1740 / NRRL 181 / WB 181) TaxID=331117 RepID=A1D9V5_NEOFI|nr:C6 finger domain protein, putative [Aspergillus fischeri NRRL 181]EAW20586.1 C6 finger domain protein, putative [Aspergillus fischeri NRRL 181]
MRSSPYSTNANKGKQRAPPRKKACQNCTKSKVRCGLEKPICSRCRSKGHSCQYPPGRVATPEIEVTAATFRSPRPRAVTSGQARRLDLDFTDIDLTPSLNAVDIRDRWLRPYLLPPLGRDEIPKAYHPFTLQYISIILRTYPRYMLKDGGFPPIIHHTQVNTNQMPQALANCYSLVRMWEQAAPGSETMVMSTVEAEMERLASETTSQHDYDLLCSFQAYLVYTILMYFSPLGNVSVVTDKTMMTLMELAFRTAQNGLLCTEEITHTRPNWESWIVVSAKRRAIYTMYLLSSVYNSDRGLPNFVADEMKGVYVPESRVLWDVTDRGVWEKEYDRHLLEWEDGMLEISELWRSTETGSTGRRERIGKWVRGVDEFVLRNSERNHRSAGIGRRQHCTARHKTRSRSPFHAKVDSFLHIN